MNITTLDKLAKLVTEYGAASIFIVIFIVSFAVLFKLFIRYVDKAFTTLQTQNEMFINKLTKPNTEPEILDNHIIINELVEAKLRILRDTVDADRTFIYLFHNTEHGIGGFAFLKASCYYEWSLTTVPSLLGKQKDLPIFLFGPALKNFAKNLKFVIKDVKEEGQLFPSVTSYMHELNSKSCMLFPIRTLDEGVIGFIGFDFINETIQDKDLDRFEEELIKTSSAVQEFLH